MERKSISKIVYLLIVILAVGVLVYLFWANVVGADSLAGKAADSKIIDFGGNVSKKEVSVIFSGDDGGKITVKKSIISSCSHKLEGFEKTATINSLIIIGADKKMLEISAPVGVHSENRQYFILDQNLCPQPLAFVKNSAIDYNIYSDQPSFKLQDFNDDDWLDIASEFRDYDKNPLLDGIRDIYLFNGQKNDFEFNRSETYQQPTND